MRSSLGLAAAAVAALAALALVGCAGFAPGAGDGSGTATIWVTKDRGATLVEKGTVPAGETLLRGLRSLGDVDTTYGGRFVESISGISGSNSGQRDWFWFVNGLLGDTSAAEYRLHAGDVAWWDIRDWGEDYDTEVVVGAFPEPFLHGYGGHVRPAAVRYAGGERVVATRIARMLRATSVAPLGTPVAKDANVFQLVTGKHRFTGALRTPGTGPKGPVVFTYSGPVADLLPARPHPYTREFSVP
jgi:hypothetical protein